VTVVNALQLEATRAMPAGPFLL